MTKLAAVRHTNSSLISKRCVVVGGTSGIGHGITKRLAAAGASVTIVGRSERSIVSIVKELEAPSLPGSIHSFVPVNTFLLSSVDEAVAIIASLHDKIDYLVQSQGMATMQGSTPSKEEGLVQEMPLHVWSRALFNRGLQPLLDMSDDPRSLSVYTASQHKAYKAYHEDPEVLSRSYCGIKNAAKVLVDKFSQEHKGTTFMHAYPGFVSTRWGTEMPTLMRWLIRGLQRSNARSKEDCGEYMVKAGNMVWTPSTLFANGSP